MLQKDDSKGLKIIIPLIFGEKQLLTIKKRSAILLLSGILLAGLFSLTACNLTQDDEASSTPPSTASQTISPSPEMESGEEANPTETTEEAVQDEPTAIPDTAEPIPVLKLCEENSPGDYCILAMGKSADQQLISIRISEDAEKNVYLMINGDQYSCRIIEDYPENLYCLGVMVQKTRDAEVKIITIDGEKILVQGVVDLPVYEVEPTKSSGGSGYY